MHTLIYALVPATDDFSESAEEMALGTATHAFDKLVGIGEHSSRVFDYRIQGECLTLQGQDESDTPLHEPLTIARPDIPIDT